MNASKVFSAIGDPTRYKIFRILMKRKDICVSEIAKILKISVPAASQQLRILESVGLIRRERMGQMICYEVNVKNNLVKEISKLIKKVEK